MNGKKEDAIGTKYCEQNLHSTLYEDRVKHAR